MHICGVVMIKTQWHHFCTHCPYCKKRCLPVYPIQSSLFNAFSPPLSRKTHHSDSLSYFRTISPSHFSLRPFCLFLSRQHILLSILSSRISTCMSESQANVSSTPLKVKQKREQRTLEHHAQYFLLSCCHPKFCYAIISSV